VPISIDNKTGTAIKKVFDYGRYQYGGPLKELWVDEIGEENIQILDNDPLSMVCYTKYISILERADWRIRSETTSRVWTESTEPGHYSFRYTASINTFIGHDEQPFEQKNVEGSIPRLWF
jgi:hypothetical protein